MTVKRTIASVLVVTAATVGIYLATSTGPKTWTVTTSAQLATAEQSAQPGDTVQLSGTFHVPFVPKTSGTATAPITYKGTATFDAAGLTTTLAAVSGRSWLVVDGLSFVNSVPTKPATNRGVILRGSSHVTIRNCHFSWMQMQLIGSSDNTLTGNSWRYFVASYDAYGHPTTSGDMLNLVLGSNRNTVTGNDMQYAGHSLIEVGNGSGNTADKNAGNWIHDNTLSNPWYKPLILSDDGSGTVVEHNLIANANSHPALYSTVPGQVGQLQMSSAAVQFSGENFVLRNNTITNAVATYGVVTLGGRWYVDANHPSGVLVESMNDEVYGNTITGNKGAAVFSFVEFLSKQDLAAVPSRAAVPRITGNLIHDNVLSGNAGSPYSWTGTTFFSTVIYHSATEAPRWVGLNTNQVYSNQGFDPTNAYLIDGIFPGGVSARAVKTLPLFESSDPTNVHGNS